MTDGAEAGPSPAAAARSGGEGPAVSVVIAAHDAAATVGATLDSLLAQTYGAWEAVVVDDGSEDTTADLAAGYAERDGRVRVERRRWSGASAARNAGIALARAPWLLFLDADDWLLPDGLELLTAARDAQPEADAVYGGWARVAPDGTLNGEEEATMAGDLFPRLARSGPFAIHSCLVRRDRVVAAGGFDESLTTCEDWVMWQRIARGGARFGVAPGTSARYRMRPDSASVESSQLLGDGLRVIALGHGPDPAVADPAPEHAGGQPAHELPGARLVFASWAGGLALGRGDDPRPLLGAFDGDPPAPLDPEAVAYGLLQSAPLPRCRTLADWDELWPELEGGLIAFLEALEERTSTPLFTRRARRALERLAAEAAGGPRPLRFGSTSAVEADLTRPARDLELPPGTERVHVTARLAERELGTVLLPASGPELPGWLMADAVAGAHGWRALGAHLAVARYGTDEPGHHDEAGWETMLRELFGLPDWPEARFYEPEAEDADPPPERTVEGNTSSVELSEPLPDLHTRARRLEVALHLGGAALGWVHLEPHRGVVRAQAVRAAALGAAGLELPRVIAREGVFGRPLDDPADLRQRLAEAAARAEAAPAPAALAGDAPLAPGWPTAVAAALPAGTAGLILTRRPGPIGVSASRRAALPAAAAAVLEETARAAQETVLRVEGSGQEVVRYVPEALPLARTGARGGTRPRTPRSLAAALRRRSRARSAGARPGELRLPILMYHRVAADGAEATARWRVHPDAFAAQVALLAERGYRGLHLEEWRSAVEQRRAPEGPAVLFTFDDAYTDFADTAWPVLRRHGFPATLFVVGGEVGGTNRWDHDTGERLDLLGERALRRLAAEGVELGAHSHAHPPLTGLEPAEVVQEAAASRTTLTRLLGRPPAAFAYPYGDVDGAVRHLVGACGFGFGVTVRADHAGVRDDMLDLPRIEVEGGDDLATFERKLRP